MNAFVASKKAEIEAMAEKKKARLVLEGKEEL
jgi:hypothetical protein